MKKKSTLINTKSVIAVNKLFNAPEPGFTITQGLQYQATDLKQWQSVLKPAKFTLLRLHCEKLNADLIAGKGVDVWGKPLPRSGYSVFRGVDVSNYIHNYLMDK